MKVLLRVLINYLNEVFAKDVLKLNNSDQHVSSLVKYLVSILGIIESV